MSHLDTQPVHPYAKPSTRTADLRKPYVQPQIIHELTLETRAGSPINGGADIPTALDQFDPRQK